MSERAENRMWRTLTTAACGHIVYEVGWKERDTKRAFEEYVSALENAGLDKSKWSVRQLNGNRAIRFENGGEVRFVSHHSQRIRGMEDDA